MSANPHSAKAEESVGRALSDYLTPVQTALELERRGFWCVPVYPLGFTDREGRDRSKSPIGEKWGARRNTAEELRATFRRTPAAQLGLCFGPGRGPGGEWLIDLEVDGKQGPQWGMNSLVRLMGGEIIESLGWSSRRGPHVIMTVEPDRIAPIIKALSAGKCEKAGPGGSGVFHLAELPDLELRLGGYHANGDAKQCQSLCPPSVGLDGVPRVWEGPEIVTAAPETFYATLDDIVKTRRVDAFLRGLLRKLATNVASSPEGTRHNALLANCRAAGGYVHLGMSEDDIEAAMVGAVSTFAYISKKERDTIRDGIAYGKASPCELPDDFSADGKVSSYLSSNSYPCSADKKARRGAVDAAEPADADDPPITARPWPEPPSDAIYHGLAGEFVSFVREQTESDPLALLVQFLIMFGSAAGRSPHKMVESTRHGCNENALLLGRSSVGRKGTSADRAREPIALADPDWAAHRIISGLSSGEGLIYNLRDPSYKLEQVKEKGRVVDTVQVLADVGVTDKRLLVFESEFSCVLRVLEREGNKLSAVIRQAFDGVTLRVATKNNGLVATDPHASIVGHCVATELQRLLANTEASSGFGNRFSYFAVRRTRLLPFGGEQLDLAPLGGELARSLAFARQTGRMDWDADARRLWAWVYPKLTEERSGLIGDLTNRNAAHALRFAMIYSLLDQSPVITEAALRASLALVEQSTRSVEYIFGDALGHPDGDAILSALRIAGAKGLTRTEITVDVFQRNATADRITRALEFLVSYQLAEYRMEETAGRPRQRWLPTTLRAHYEYEKNEVNEQRRGGGGTDGDLISSSSFLSSSYSAESEVTEEGDAEHGDAWEPPEETGQ